MRDIPIKQDNVGDVLPAGDFNATQSEVENLVTTTDQTLDPSGGADTDLYMMSQAAAAYGSGGDYYTDGGTADAYVLSRASNMKSIPSYIDGLKIIFVVDNTNTGASTVNVTGLGTKNITYSDGAALLPGTLVSGKVAVCIFDDSNDRFELLFGNELLNLSNSSGGFFTYKNKFMNGNLDVWQEGNIFTSISSGNYGPDGWKYTDTGAMVFDLLRDTDVPTGLRNFSMKLDVTTAQSSLGAGDHASISAFVEGYDLANLGDYLTLSFWVKSAKTGIHCISFKNSGIDRSYIIEYTVNSTNTWELKNVAVPLNYTGGTWDYTNGTGLNITWSMGAGSNWHTTKDAWQSGSYLSTSNQVNICDSTSNNFWIKEAQIEKGRIATPYDHIGGQHDNHRCLRYKIVHPADYPLSNGFTSANNFASIYYTPFEMRIDPSLSGPTTYTLYVNGSSYTVTPSTIVKYSSAIRMLFTGTFADTNYAASVEGDTNIVISAEF